MTIKLRGSSDGSVSLSAPADTSPTGTDITLTLPTDAGSANQFLKNSGTAGTLDYSSMVETSTGVGIGTASPTTPFSVRSSSNITTYGDVSAQFSDNSTGTLYVQHSSGKVQLGSDSALAFGSGTSATERMRIDSSGRLLVGTSTASSYADRLLTVGNTSHASPTIEIRSSTTGFAGLVFSDSSAADSSSYRGTLEYDHTNDLMQFRTAGNIVQVIDSSGRLLLGTTTEGYADWADNLTIADSANCGITIRSGTSNSGSIYFSDATSGAEEYDGYIVYNQSTRYMQFGTATVERMRIGSTGTVQTYASGSTDSLFLSNSTSAGTSVILLGGRHSATSPTTGTLSFRVYTNGNVQNTNNSYGAISDAKLKENIVDASSQWNDLKAIQIRNYNFIEGQTHTQIGVVAQEVETVSPGLVTESPDFDDEGNDLGTVTKSVNYSVLYMKAVKALQEAMERIETLETKIAALEAA